MMFFKNHHFAIQAFFDYSVVISFAIPKGDVQHLIPNLLKLDLFENKFAFFTIALVKVKNLRPKGFPAFLGQDFHLIGHRLFVQYHNKAGKGLRGLYILKSQTDSSRMKLLGNLMTHYNYEKVSIDSQKVDDRISIAVHNLFSFQAKMKDENISLPRGSVFNNWKEARRFAGPLPFTFSKIEQKKMLIVEGVRNNWKPKPLEIESIDYDFSKYSFMKNAILSNAFIVEQIPYYWKKGRIEKW